MVTINDFRILRDASMAGITLECLIDQRLYDGWSFESAKLVHYSNLDDDGNIIDDTKCYDFITDREQKALAGILDEDSLKNYGLLGGASSIEGQMFVVKFSFSNDDDSSLHVDDEMAFALDWKKLYDVGMPYVADFAAYGFSECDTPKAFEELVVMWSALQLAVSAGDFAQISVLWKKFLRLAGENSQNKQCGCKR